MRRTISPMAGLVAAAAAASMIGAPIHHRERERPKAHEVDLRDVPGTRQRKRWLERQARKRQRQAK